MKRFAIAATALALAGCAGNLQFREDDRLTFLRPPDRSEVTVPVVVEWSIEGFEIGSPDGGSDPRRGFFAVFVDREPMRPGHDLKSLAEDDDPACFRARGCPDRTWLEEHYVYLAARTRVAIPVLRGDRGRRAGERRRRHEITVVLLDGRGVRIGEASWTRIVYAAEPPS